MSRRNPTPRNLTHIGKDTEEGKPGLDLQAAFPISRLRSIYTFLKAWKQSREYMMPHLRVCKSKDEVCILNRKRTS